MTASPFEAAAAGLLHDIGKFALRAGESTTQLRDSEAQQLFGHEHALLTSDFISQFVPKRWAEPIHRPAAFHHRPQDWLSAAVAVADRLSAGERSDQADDSRAAQPRQLLTIFSDLYTEEGVGKDAYLPLGELRIEKDALKPGDPKPDNEVNSAYADLWKAFKREAASLHNCFADSGDLDVYLEGLLMLLQRFTWMMPSAYYRSRPDISLYDHGRMTAALSAVLAGSGIGEAEMLAMAQNPEGITRPVALLVGGDLSGVQDFIYTITSRGAASALRGRSFYLQILTEALVRFILRRLDLPCTNLIYAGGGHFYLLARPADAEKLGELQRRISEVLLEAHHGDLYLALGWVELAGTDFFEGRISEAWERVGLQLQRAKQRRFSELGGGLVKVFEPQGHGGNEDKQCQVCGQEHPGTRKFAKDGEDEGVRKCPDCLAYEALGEQLRNAEALLLERVSAEGEAPADGWEKTLARLGLRARLFDGDKWSSLPAGGGVLLALSDDALPKLACAPGSNRVTGRRLLVNITPIFRQEDQDQTEVQSLKGLPAVGSVKPFEVMEVQSHGVKRLGVLRMDVDNLGKLFSEGFKLPDDKGNRATLSRVAGLSFAISLFIEGWVELIGKEMNAEGRKGKRGDSLYSIYSGGDDLFVVGGWDQVVEFARRVRADLSEFTAGHPGVHASAGIALVGGKYPLSQAALDAGRAEHKAKAHRWAANGRSGEKDSVSFLGQALDWATFGLEECDETGENTAHATFHRLMEVEESVRTSLIRRLGRLYALYAEKQTERARKGLDRRKDGGRQDLFGPWNWRAAYLLRRIEKKDPNVERLRAEIQSNDFASIEWIGLAARWAELWDRGTGEG